MSQKVLIIDDDFSIHAVVIARMANQRLEFISAYDGESGLKMAAAEKPELILLDLDMPNIHGYEVCRRLKSDPETQGIPILFLTAEGEVSQRIRGLDLGAMDYIVKPFDPSELRARIAVALRNQNRIEVLSRNSMFDEMTGLYNRVYLARRLDADLALARRSGRPLAYLRISLDDHRAIRERFGQTGLDRALRATARALEHACRKEDVLGRFAADEFAVLATEADPTRIEDLGERIRSAVNQTVRLDDDESVEITCSIGVALSGHSVGRSIVHLAGGALYHAQTNGGNRVHIDGEPAEQVAIAA